MIIITGALGFIGSVLLKELNDQGRDDIIIIDRFGKGPKWINVRGLRHCGSRHRCVCSARRRGDPSSQSTDLAARSLLSWAKCS